MTHYLKFSSEKESLVIAESLGFTVQDKTGKSILVPYTENRAIDVVGIIYKPTGRLIPVPDYTLTCPEMAPLDGWYWNMRCVDLPKELKQFEVFPSTPYREFA